MRIIVIIILVILVLSSVLLYLFRNSGLRDRGEGMYITNTNNRLINLSDIILGDVRRDKVESLPKEMDELLKWFYARNPDVREIYELENWLDSETVAFIDAWGNPIELKVNSLNEYTFISAGPNQQFEDGKGDDITCSFNPYPYKEEEKQKEGNSPIIKSIGEKNSVDVNNHVDTTTATTGRSWRSEMTATISKSGTPTAII